MIYARIVFSFFLRATADIQVVSLCEIMTRSTKHLPMSPTTILWTMNSLCSANNLSLGLKDIFFRFPRGTLGDTHFLAQKTAIILIYDLRFMRTRISLASNIV